MSDTPETDQLVECDEHRVDEDGAEYSAYRRMVEHARELERRLNARGEAEAVGYVITHFQRKAADCDIEAKDCPKTDWGSRERYAFEMKAASLRQCAWIVKKMLLPQPDSQALTLAAPEQPRSGARRVS